MRIKSMTCLLLLGGLTVQAQTRFKSLAEAKQAIWYTETPIFSNVKVPERFKTAQAIILGIEFKGEYDTDGSELFCGIVLRKQIQLNQLDGVKRFKRFSFAEQVAEVSPKPEATTLLGLRVLKNGTSTEVNVPGWETVIDLDVSQGDIVDFFVCQMETYPSEGGHIFAPVILFQQDIYPIVGGRYAFEVNKEFYLVTKSRNEATKFANKQTPNTIKYTLDLPNTERHPVQIFSPFLRTVPHTLIEVSHTATEKDIINSFVDLGAPGKAKHTISPKDVLLFFSDKLDKKIGGKLYYEAIAKDWGSYMKRQKVSPKKDAQNYVRELYYYLRNRYSVKGEPTILDQRGMVEAMSYLMTKNKIEHELIVATPNYKCDIKEIATYDDVFLILKFKDDRTFYIATFGANDNINDVPPSVMAGKVYSINISEKPEYQRIKPIPFTLGDYSSNRSSVSFTLLLDSNKVYLKKEARQTGYLRKNDQNLLIVPADFWQQESKYGLSPLSDSIKKTQYAERNSRLAKALKDKTDADFQISSVTIFKDGRNFDEPELEYSVEMTSENFASQQNQTITLPVTKLIELPALKEDDKLTRRGDVFFPAAGVYQFKFKIDAPSGYQITAVEASKKAENDVGGAEYTIKNTGDQLEMNLKYYFKNASEPAIFWPKTADLIRVIMEFGQSLVTLEKK